MSGRGRERIGLPPLLLCGVWTNLSDGVSATGAGLLTKRGTLALEMKHSEKTTTPPTQPRIVYFQLRWSNGLSLDMEALLADGSWMHLQVDPREDLFQELWEWNMSALKSDKAKLTKTKK